MQENPAVRSVKQAMRVLKHMNTQAEELAPIHDLGRQALKEVLEGHMRQRIELYLGDVRRMDHPDRRNGHFRRWLLTGLGAIQLAVPRTRHYSAIGALEAHARREKSVDRLILAAFVLGLSTRKVGEALLAILGERISATTVSRVAQQLDVAVEAFHRRPLANRYRALLLDGVVLANRSGRGVVRRPVLVAMGITNEGKKEILDFVIARGESQAAWEAFLNDLHGRGLTGEGLAIAICDGGAGLLAALPLVYPRVRVQRCWAHKVRNVLDKVKRADREAVKRELESHQQRRRSNHGATTGASVRRSLAATLPRGGALPVDGHRVPADLLRVRRPGLAPVDTHHQRHRAALPRGPPAHAADGRHGQQGQHRAHPVRDLHVREPEAGNHDIVLARRSSTRQASGRTDRESGPCLIVDPGATVEAVPKPFHPKHPVSPFQGLTHNS